MREGFFRVWREGGRRTPGDGEMSNVAALF